MYRVGRIYVTAHSLYEGATDERIPVADFVAGSRYDDGRIRETVKKKQGDKK